VNFFKRLAYLPLELGYRTGVFFRNLWYDYINKGHKFPVKVISVGNLSVGGTGKTPMAEWLINYAISCNISCAYLSRGYGRKTHGFILVQPEAHTAIEVGDEALQVASNFHIPVAVCENRVLGVQELLKKFPDLQLIILDDAFQHRKIYRDLDILMIDPSHSPFKDYLLPTGRLREPASNHKRAQLAIISKANLFSPNELKSVSSRIKIPKAQAKLVSLGLRNCFDYSEIPLETINRNPCYAISGIGNNRLFIKQLFATNLNVIGYKAYKDHYMIKEHELKKVVYKCKDYVKNKIFHVDPVIVMTEKDFYRLKNQPYFIKQEIEIYFLKVGFHFDTVPKEIEKFFMQFE
jgi:tetraacyldisaccharide 4'-kinase